MERFDTIHVIIRGVHLKGLMLNNGHGSLSIRVMCGGVLGNHTMPFLEATVRETRMVLFEKIMKPPTCSVLYSGGINQGGFVY